MGLPNYYLIYSGETFDVEFFITLEGKTPAFEYYEKLTEEEKRRFFVVIKFISDSPIGTIFQKTMFNIENKEQKIYAIKLFQQTIFYLHNK